MPYALTVDPLRLALAAGTGLSWAGLCWAGLILPRWRPRRHGAPAVASRTLVAYASQSGLAAELAQQLARAKGTTAQPLDSIDPAALAGVGQAWFLVATTGDGNAPDTARRFAGAIAAARPGLQGLRYGLLALGDRHYPAFCGFGRAVDDWLQECGAAPIFPRIEVDRGAPADLARWAAATDLRTDPEPEGLWRLIERETLSPATETAPVCRLLLAPLGPAPRWRPGAIADVTLTAPDGSPQRRSYSVASLAETGTVELLLRHRRDAAGNAGLASGWLSTGLALNGQLRMTLRDNPGVAPLPAEVPKLLLATGTGLAGVLAHLRAHLAVPGHAPVWLIHGERHAALPLLTELTASPRPGLRIDLPLSRGTPPRRLPDWLPLQAEALRRFVAAGAAVLACGGQGPGAAALAALEECLGPGSLAQLRTAGRLRTDFY
ncbi:flavodoxin domain-containing protein [Phaeovulum sp. W22_SRMD_FR3]|uniref:flavodoxin domain-containing protein n=1 Tax=Phaeovulum sp. W22_SRMD_FR3 TaxID=3240274 RepID=UPI003F9D8A0F